MNGEENIIPCSCEECGGLNRLHKRTVRRHLSKSSQQPNKKLKATQENDRLHHGTTMSSFLLALRVLSLYNKYAGMTQQCVTDVLKLITDILGSLVASDQVPWNFRELNSFMSSYMPKEKRMTACPEECSLFDGNEHQCTKEKCRGKPGKAYHYMPLIPRLCELYASPEIAKHLQEHASSSSQDDVMSDIHDAPEWKNLYGKGGKFENDRRAIALEFSADGFSPFHHSTSKPYSVEQQASLILNLPPDMRIKPGFVLLHGLIPGPSAPKEEKYNIYLRPVVDELKQLEKGVPAYDAYTGEAFNLRASILLHVHDFPGQAKVFQGTGSGGILACPMCKTKGTYSSELKKTIYRSGREFLDRNDPLREDSTFPGGGNEYGLPQLRNFAQETVMTALNGTFADKAKNAPNRSLEKRMAKAGSAAVTALGARKRCSEFDRLGYEEASKIAVEGMHTIQGVAKHVHGLLNGHGDGVGVRAHEKAINRFPGCYVDDRGRLPDAPFRIAKGDLAIADGRLRNVSIPPGKGVVPKDIFGNFHSMKSHTWHIVMTKGVYPFVLRGLLGASQNIALLMLCHVLRIFTAKSIHRDLIERMKRCLHRSLCIMDREFPETIKTILWHMLRHLPTFLEKYGPIHTYWMFYFERQIHHHVSRLHSSRHPEAAMINSYKVDVLCTMVEYTTIFDSVKQQRTQQQQQQQQDVIKTFSEQGKGWTWRGEEKWADRGSIVHTRDANSGCVFFGRVNFFYEIPNIGKYACIHWFESPLEDAASKLYVCNPESHNAQINPVVAFKDLSEPLITATDNGSLFVLDFMDKIRCAELLDWMESIN